MKPFSTIQTILVLCLFINACTPGKMKYPVAKKSDTVDVYFGHQVKDPYRRLEELTSAETKEWIKEENDLTFSYLNKIPYRSKMKQRLEELINYQKHTQPWQEGKYLYYEKNSGLQNQYVLYRSDLNNKNEELVIDPNKLSADATSSIEGLSFTKDGNLMAFQVSEAGADWRKILVMDMKTLKYTSDTLKDVKFSEIAWKGSEGFFYSIFPKSTNGNVLKDVNENHALYYHKLGTSQKDDKFIFGGEATKLRSANAYVTEDEAFLIIVGAKYTTGNQIYTLDLRKNGATIQPMVTDFNNDHLVYLHRNNKFYIYTNLNAPNYRMIQVDDQHPAPENWTDVIKETENVLNITTAKGFFFANYIVDVKSKVLQYSLDGKLIREVSLPCPGEVSGFSCSENDSVIYYTFTSFTYPSTIYSYNPADGKSVLYWQPKIKTDMNAFTTEQVFYKSADGVKIPMYLVYKKGLKKDGKNPVFLYAYGGFNISLLPSFSAANLAWLEQGGIYALANLRGGGEYGQNWHKAGMQLNKKNVFNDFIGAAEYLTSEKYTSPNYIAISGGSNGGLLIGAVMTMRPDLFKVAIPRVGVLDMLRYHKFTAGASWATDYGTSDDSEEMFKYLLSYSPVHNVKDSVSYPATLVMTSDHDDRVVPAHSYKFAAVLQEKQAGDAPVLIRIATNTGHGAGRPLSKVIDEYADIFSFIFKNMGIEPVYK